MARRLQAQRLSIERALAERRELRQKLRTYSLKRLCAQFGISRAMLYLYEKRQRGKKQQPQASYAPPSEDSCPNATEANH